MYDLDKFCTFHMNIFSDLFTMIFITSSNHKWKENNVTVCTVPYCAVQSRSKVWVVHTYAHLCEYHEWNKKVGISDSYSTYATFVCIYKSYLRTYRIKSNSVTCVCLRVCVFVCVFVCMSDPLGTRKRNKQKIVKYNLFILILRT